MANERILVVEDEILVAREIEGYLCKIGYSVVGIAASANTALEKIAELQPDLVLVDIVLKGGQDGIYVAQQVRDRFHIPVVYLTAYVDAPTLDRAKSTSPFGYILKPFGQHDLRATIEIALARHQTELAEKSSILEGTDSRSFEYLSILSHELRNPLSAIQLSIAMLEDSRHSMDAAKKQQLLHRIQSSVDCMNQLIEDVLTIGQTDRNTMLFNPEMTDMVEFCQILLEPLQWNPEEQHPITFSCSSNCIYAQIDQRLLWHLLNNLIGNAIKYSPEATPILLQLYQRDEEICFEVQDQGIGIPPEDLAHLFQPFRRGGNVGELPGTGLGLAIARRVVELHEGKITVESQVGHGTTFIVSLPLRSTM